MIPLVIRPDRGHFKGGGRELGHKVCYAPSGNPLALTPGASTWPGENTGELNFLALERRVR